MRFSRSLLSFCALALLVACSTDGTPTGEEEQVPVDVLYGQATEAMEEERYKSATKFFEEVERQHPYSPKAKQAQLMAAYASYLDQRYDEATLALDRFIELHPGSDKIDYAYYLKALCYYEQISDVRRDQDMTEQAMRALDTLIRLFPQSEYARDAKLKKDLTLDHLAGKEMEIGRYYLNRGHINAALTRFQTVVKEYQTTTHVAEALHRLVEGYLTLGLKDEAARVAAVLGYNYPGSEWYERTYKLLDDEARKQIIAERGFVDKTIESIFKPD